MRRIASLALAALLVSLLGCATTPSRPPLVLTGDPMVDGPRAIQDGPPRDQVLWQYRTALAALHNGQYDIAAQHLDAALDRIEGILGHDKSARKARGYFTAEAKKTFLGEPYERVMAYYYRGLLYWIKGDLGNARACYRSAQLQDADVEENTYASDYALLDYLDGYATLKLGQGDPGDELRHAQSLTRAHRLPDYPTNANVLFFVTYGNGPDKYASGAYAEQLRFRPGPPSPVRSARIRIAEGSMPAPPYDDLYFQATTRGGRVMDHILANKAVFKASTDTAGNAALVSGMVLAGDRRHQDVGLGLLAFGLVSKAIAGGTTPEADTRSWENLPLYLSFAAAKLIPGKYSAACEFLDEQQRPISGLTKTVNFEVTANSADKVIFVSDKSVTPQNL